MRNLQISFLFIEYATGMTQHLCKNKSSKQERMKVRNKRKSTASENNLDLIPYAESGQSHSTQQTDDYHKMMTQESYWKHLKKCVVEFAVFTYEGEIFPAGGLPVNK